MNGHILQIATTFGAQFFKIPLSTEVKDNPMFLLHSLVLSTAVLIVTFAGAYVAKFWKKSGGDDDNANTAIGNGKKEGEKML